MAIENIHRHSTVHDNGHIIINLKVGRYGNGVVVDRSHADLSRIFLYIAESGAHMSVEEAEEIALSLLMVVKEVKGDH